VLVLVLLAPPPPHNLPLLVSNDVADVAENPNWLLYMYFPGRQSALLRAPAL
jgi:hypothetical protein